MFESILVANRGEIARRIIRTCLRLGVRTVAAHSEADVDLPFVREADVAICIGPAPARESYLHGETILRAAAQSGAKAIHPGYGFLSENAAFAQRVLDAGLGWIGAPPAAIAAMGLKDAAKIVMVEAGVPVTPGYHGADQTLARLRSEARKIGFPVLIKAVAGGGGKGMRKVGDEEEFASALESCRRESKAAFGDERVLIEKYVSSPRHIEVQIFGDAFGDIVHLFERDCSVQRRHQKVIEEAPAPGMDDATRSAICAAAINAAKAVGYVGAGTVEFIADGRERLSPDRVWFMEMNTRLQVEHPVTEAITGIDLVEWQLRVAAGEPLPLAQSAISMQGHAIEARLYAENPEAGFLPSIGRLEHLSLPASIRVDSGVDAGNEITAHYDPMIAKLIAHGPSRLAALENLERACRSVEVWPVKANAGFLARALAEPAFREGGVDTGFIEDCGEALTSKGAPSQEICEAAAYALTPIQPHDPWAALRGFRIAAPLDMRVDVVIAGQSIEVVAPMRQPSIHVVRTNSGAVAFADGEAWPFDGLRISAIESGESVGDGVVLSPMPGRFVAVFVNVGEAVSAGQALAALEAMKMEHILVAPFDGVVAEFHAKVGAQAQEGAVVARVSHDEAAQSPPA